MTDCGVEDSLWSPTMSATRIFFARGAPSRISLSCCSTSSRRCFNWFSRRCDSSKRLMRSCSDLWRISSPLLALFSSCSSWATLPRNSSLMTSSSLTRVLSDEFEAISCSYVWGTSRPWLPFNGEVERPGDGWRRCIGGRDGE